MFTYRLIPLKNFEIFQRFRCRKCKVVYKTLATLSASQIDFHFLQMNLETLKRVTRGKCKRQPFLLYSYSFRCVSTRPCCKYRAKGFQS